MKYILIAVLLFSTPVLAQSDVPLLEVTPVLTPRPAWVPSWQDCRRWDLSERNWKKVQRWSIVVAGVSGALGAVLALSLKSEEAGAIGGFAASLSGGTAWLAGEQAEDYSKQFDEWCRN